MGAIAAGFSTIGAAFYCMDCGDYHRLQVLVSPTGQVAPIVGIDNGPGGGYWYRLTDEDLGVPDGLSVPVYRPTAKLESVQLQPRARRA